MVLWSLLFLTDVDGGVGDDIIEDRSITEVDEGVDGVVFCEELAEFFAIASTVEFIGGDEGEGSVWLE